MTAPRDQRPSSLLADDRLLGRLTEHAHAVRGVAALALGGSRARGTAAPGSDYDIGVYYAPAAPLDIVALRDALSPLCDDGACNLTELGAWGPRINGGGWLRIGGEKVDILYRDLASVAATIADCRDGRVAMDYQPGHPHGFCSAIWMGEVALCLPLHDPAGALAELKRRTQPYPDALGAALIAKFQWEARFAADNAALAISRGDLTHIAGCAHRTLCCAAQVLFALNQRYLINEKGAIDAAALLPRTIPGLGERTHSVWRAIAAGKTANAIASLIAIADDLDLAVSGNAAG